MVNGFPHSGTHALHKALMLLGVEDEIAHVPYPAKVEPHFFIKRDPRNIACSMIRHLGKPVTGSTFIECLSNPEFQEIHSFTPWVSEAPFVASYEGLDKSDGEIRRLADHLRRPYPEGAFDLLPGATVTWRHPHSDYREVWSPIVSAAWDNAMGNDLMREWGYV